VILNAFSDPFLGGLRKLGSRALIQANDQHNDKAEALLKPVISQNRFNDNGGMNSAGTVRVGFS